VVLAVPLAVVFLRLGMFDQTYSLALMHAALTLPTTILVVASVFMSLPYEFEEAAQVFGCTRLQAFWRVVLPLATLLLALATVQYWQQDRRIAEIEEIDAQLLTDDLPIDAYLDRGFQNWLKKRSAEQ
jgi:ABC-type tungstate transport system substrate-binding protein